MTERSKTLSDGTKLNVTVHGRPKGARKVQLPGGMYYLKRGDDFYVYDSGGEFVTALRSAEQAKAYASRHTDRTEDKHGGYKVGDQVIWQNPMGVDKHPGEVVALHRNGNLHIREPEFRTTVDVHHTKVTRKKG